MSSLKRNLGKCVGGWERAERRASVLQALESNSALWTLMGRTTKEGFHRGNEGLRKKKQSRTSVLKEPVGII